MTKLLIEFCALYLLVPLAFRYSPRPLPALPVLWAVGLYCAYVSHGEGHLDRAHLVNGSPLAHALPSMLLLFAGVALVMLAVMRIRRRLPLFLLPRTQPGLWLLLMVLYPLLSVYPQAFIYRAFFFERYQALFPTPQVLILASALVFAFMHLVFRNWVAVSLTFLGGLLFAWRYQQTGSLLTSAMEHALYGCWLFTVGLGGYFYHGTYRLAQQAEHAIGATVAADGT